MSRIVLAFGCFGLVVLLSLTTGKTDVTAVPTGVFLDTNDNQVMLEMVDGKPIQFFSKIFTPVCETGECKPIFINIYWDLVGNYLRYDQPEGEILTKSDHVPFTPSDYELLDEILRGEDPRYGSIAKHSIPNPSSDSQQKQNNQSQSDVAVMQKVFLTKDQMVDGVTGATLDPHVTKFVPGALYTTYTCWDLANSSKRNMFAYAVTNLMNEQNYQHLLTLDSYEVRNRAILNVGSTHYEDYGYTLEICRIIEVSEDEEFILFLLNHLSYYDIEERKTEKTFEKLLFGNYSNKIKLKVLDSWRVTVIPPDVLKRFTNVLNNDEELFWSVLATLRYQEHWPDELGGILIAHLDVLEQQEMRQRIYELILEKAKLSAEEKAELKKAKKKYDLKG